MDIEKLISSRRIIKKFKAEPIDQNLLLSWLKTASMAPNHRMTEPWEIVFIGSETRAKLNHKTDFGNAPTVFAVLSNIGSLQLVRDENMVAVSCFIQNFMLLAWSAGVGCFWSSLGVSAPVRHILNVSDEYEVIGIFGAGYPEEIPEAKKRTEMDAKITYLL
ncbi:nitroreductase [Peribacillus deserti]|uniref:Nitroreductase n=1 Tax=Peribacillus deserti TaxID=673318 RepID=A0ABS2QE13_9BACI|nr:nitroreductase family protein [Peribacillus deserti]MBM7691049.1 nitroreductase [Peribacillus deserti]